MDIHSLPEKVLQIAQAIAGEVVCPPSIDEQRYTWHLEHAASQHPEEDVETLAGRALGRLLVEQRKASSLRAGAEPPAAAVTADSAPAPSADLLLSVIAWLRGIAAILLLILAALVLFAARAHAQLDGVRIRDEGAIIKQWAGGFADINCVGTGVNCSWDSVNRRVNVTVSAVGGGTITIREQDGVPSVSADTLEFDQAVGFVGSNPVSGTFRVTLSNVPQSVVQNLVTDLAAKVPSSRVINTTAPLGGGGALSADLTLTCSTCEVTSNKNAASGYAGLTAGTKLQTAQGQEVWSIVDLTDVDALTGLAANDILYYSGTTWTRRASAPKADALAANPADCAANQFANAIDAAGNLTCAQVAVANVVAILKTRSITYIVGSDTGAALADTDDQQTIWVNRLGQGIHIVEIWCESDAGTPIINVQKDDGTPANILSSNLTCSSSGASSTSFTSGEDAVANGDRLDHVTVTAGGTAKRITVNIKYTLD